MKRNHGHSNPTEKQLSYAGALARKLGVGQNVEGRTVGSH